VTVLGILTGKSRDTRVDFPDPEGAEMMKTVVMEWDRPPGRFVRAYLGLCGFQ